jgi:hypothetical protein
MWELICHHTYKWAGRPVDISRYDNPAEASGGIFLADGVAKGSGALRFFSPNAHVRVYPGVAWNPLGAIKVELTVRLTEPSTNSQTLIEGDSSFGVFVSEEKLFGYFVGKSIYPGMNSDGLNTYQDGVAFPGYRVPYGKWVVLTFVHDGFSQMRLYADGVPVTVARSVLAGVPPVGPAGISIGNGLNGGAPFGGDIDEVRVWRVDPYAGIRQFVARPADKATIACWERFSESLDKALAKYPDCAIKLDADFVAILGRLARAILDKGPETQQRFFDFRKEFDRLWRAGRIGGPEMSKLFADWITWMRLVGISIETDPGVQAFQNSTCLKLLLAETGQCTCDPKYNALLKLIAKASSQSSAHPAAV